MAEKIEGKTTNTTENPLKVKASRYGERLLPHGMNPGSIAAYLDAAKNEDLYAAGQELNAMAIHDSGLPETLFGTKDTNEMVREAAKWRKKIAGIVEEAIDEPWVGSRGVTRVEHFFDEVLSPSLSASLIGDVIERVPAYQPFYPLVLKRTGPKDYQAARSGQDTLQYEDPIDIEEAYNFDPQGAGGALVISVVGSNSTIYPYFKESPRHSLDFHEWAQRLIDVPLRMKNMVMQELNRGWDADVITHFDAIVPDASLYSSHPTHQVTINNTPGGVTVDKFKEAARKVLFHTDSTGIYHEAVPGFALCDGLPLLDIEDWGTDVWTDDEVSDIAKNGIGLVYDSRVVTRMRVHGFDLLRMPGLQTTDRAYRKVRFFAQPQQVGYFVPITLNGKNVFTSVGPMSGRDPDWLGPGGVRNVTSPPGFAFTVQVSMGGALQIVNPYGTALLTHS